MSGPRRKPIPRALIVERVRLNAARRKALAAATEANKALSAARKRLAALGVKEAE